MALKTKDGNGNRKIFYNGSELLGYTSLHNGETTIYSAKRIRAFHLAYEGLLRTGNYKKARELESKKILPETWLNGVVSDLIDESMNNGSDLARKLVEAFKERGYDESWLQKG